MVRGNRRFLRMREESRNMEEYVVSEVKSLKNERYHLWIWLVGSLLLNIGFLYNLYQTIFSVKL